MVTANKTRPIDLIESLPLDKTGNHYSLVNQRDSVRLLIADDHTLFRESLCLALRDIANLEVVGEASNGREAVEKAAQLCPDVVLMDLVMPLLNGLDATRRIKKEDSNIKVLIITGHAYDDFIYHVIEAGASGYLLKTSDVTELQLALQEVYRGNPYVSSDASRALINDLMRNGGRRGRAARNDRLTVRERELLQLFAEGYSNQEIASQLFLSVKTVEAHKANIMSKLNLKGRIDLIKYAMRRGLVAR